MVGRSHPVGGTTETLLPIVLPMNGIKWYTVKLFSNPGHRRKPSLEARWDALGCREKPAGYEWHSRGREFDPPRLHQR